MNRHARIVALLGLALLLALPHRAHARGCLAAGTPILTPGGSVAIEKISVGDEIYSVTGDHLQPARVMARYQVTADVMLEIRVGGRLLRVTPEHPLQISPGVFVEAGSLQPGQTLYIRQDSTLRPCPIDSIQRVNTREPAYNLLVSPNGTYLANGIVVHNKGCFLPDTPILKSDGSEVPIRDIRPGDRLKAFTYSGDLTTATVENIVTFQVTQYCRVTTDKIILDVTPEHPFFVGNATFKTLESLTAGDSIYAYDGTGLSAQKIVSIQTISANVTVYNLQTDEPHTFFAHGVAVHNKGGCFPAGTMIQTPAGQIPIERIIAGDLVNSLSPDGRISPTPVEAVFQTRSSLLILQAGDLQLKTTAEHPIATAGGQFVPAGNLHVGDRILFCSSLHPRLISITAILAPPGEEPVYNLTVAEPHTFIADGFVVHNKGGGGHSSSGHSSGSHYYYYGGHTYYSSSGGSFWENWGLLFIFLAIFGYIFVRAFIHIVSSSRNSGELDFVYRRGAIDSKAAQTERLLQYFAPRDHLIDPAALRSLVTAVFVQLQQSWQSRDYHQMQPMLMPDLYHTHVAQLAAMLHHHEINHIEDLVTEKIDIVNIRYTQKPEQREFTALITASARDYFTDDRTGSFIRGDRALKRFQEFWIFHFCQDHWLLREIEQTRESTALKDQNHVDGLTPEQLIQIVGDATAAAPPIGDSRLQDKSSRIDSMLEKLAKTDPMWDRAGLVSRARDLFVAVLLAREACDPSQLTGAELMPQALADLQSRITAARSAGERVEYRNLCVRKVDLILINDYPDKSRCEFTARVTAHAQTIKYLNTLRLHADEYETPFEQYLVFARSDNSWKLSQILPPAQGAAAMAAKM